MVWRSQHGAGSDVGGGSEADGAEMDKMTGDIAMDGKDQCPVASAPEEDDGTQCC